VLCSIFVACLLHARGVRTGFEARLLKHCRAQRQNVGVIVTGAPHNREYLSAIRVTYQRRARVWPQVSAQVLNHRAQIAPVLFIDVETVQAAKHKREEEQLDLQTVIAG